MLCADTDPFSTRNGSWSIGTLRYRTGGNVDLTGVLSRVHSPSVQTTKVRFRLFVYTVEV